MSQNQNNIAHLSQNRKTLLTTSSFKIGKNCPFYIRLDAFNCILTHCDRRRYSRARGLQELPRPLLSRPLYRAFHFISYIFHYFGNFWQCSTFAALRGGSTGRCCGRQGWQRALARGGIGQQAFAARWVASLPPVSDGSNFSRAPFGVLTAQTGTLAGQNVVR